MQRRPGSYSTVGLLFLFLIILSSGCQFVSKKDKKSSTNKGPNNTSTETATDSGTTTDILTSTGTGQGSTPCQKITGSNLCQIEETLLRDQVHHQATHNSQGQKALQNKYGIFVSYAPLVYNDSDNESTSDWVVARSQDGGKTFQTIYETSQHHILPPAIATDENGDLYSVHGTGNDWVPVAGIPMYPKRAFFYKFSATQNFQNPVIVEIPKCSTDKSDFMYDLQNKKFYYMTFNDTYSSLNPIPNFFVLTPAGAIERQVAFSKALSLDGKYAKIMYPHLATDGQRVIAAWSTEYDPPGASDPSSPEWSNLYRNVSFTVSDDFGATWKNMAGSSISVPAVMDDTGPATLVTEPDEIGDHNWLGSIRYLNQRVFVSYQIWGKAHPGSHPHFSTFNLGSNQRESDMRKWDNSTMQPDGTGSLVVDPKNPAGPIYYVAGGDYSGKNVLNILSSQDQGKTWADYAAGTFHDGDPPVANLVSTQKNITDDGYIIGVFTRCQPRAELGRCESYMNGNYTLDSRVYFFRVKAR